MNSRATAMVGGATLALSVAATSDAASFDCKKAEKAAEITVCDSGQLSQLDVKMATLYHTVLKLVPMGEGGNTRDQQTAFLADRNACGSKTTCIRDLYDARIDKLQQQIDRVAEGGPY
ncbi:MAG: hypothetical protein WBG92_22365 [Thiohalocapsa sp.]